MLAVLVLFLSLALSISASASVPFNSYNYNFWRAATPAAHAYLPETIMDGEVLGTGALRNPSGIAVDTLDRLFVLDAGNNRLLVYDLVRKELLHEIRTFAVSSLDTGTFNNPQGLFVSAKNHLYVCDTQNRRIIEFDQELSFVRFISAPKDLEEGVLPPNFDYRPVAIVVDQAERMYVVSTGVYDGIMEFTHEGDFRGFIGAPRVSPSVMDYFWSRLATEEQKVRRRMFLPIEYSNLDMDPLGFIYATVSEGAAFQRRAVRRLNPTGNDVLRTSQTLPPPHGDIVFPLSTDPTATIRGRSVLVDIVARPEGLYSVLDRNRGRIFTYDQTGELLYIFGGLGGQEGLFRNPVALASYEDRLLVLDASLGQITVFSPSLYARSIHDAIYYHNRGLYQEATEKWYEVLDLNVNYELAYSGIGRSLLRQQSYLLAMENFKLANNRQGYSKAFAQYRRNYVTENFSFLMSLFMGLLLFLVLASKLGGFRFAKKHFNRLLDRVSSHKEQSATQTSLVVDGLKVPYRRVDFAELIRSLQFAWYAMFHPVDGFWDLKYERRGNGVAACILVFLATLTHVLQRQYTGFIFNTHNLSQMNLFLEMLGVLGPITLGVIVNWALTTLSEGKGSLRDIFIAVAYGLTPFIVLGLPSILLSHYLTFDEGAFLHFLRVAALLWSGLLIFVGTMSAHEFFTGKNVLIVTLTFVGVGVTVFIGLLFFSLVGQVVQFVQDIYSELVFRL